MSKYNNNKLCAKVCYVNYVQKYPIIHNRNCFTEVRDVMHPNSFHNLDVWVLAKRRMHFSIESVIYMWDRKNVKMHIYA